MGKTLHITSGDCAGDSLAKSGISGEVFIWHDILYDGPRNPGWPDDDILDACADRRASGKIATMEEQGGFETIPD